LLSCFYSTPGYTNEKLHVYLAGGLIPGRQHTDEDEFIQMERYPLEKVLSMIDNGEIKDAKTIVGLLAAKRFLDNKQKGQ
jgi:ADP-ribose pyrophosphatase